MPPATVLARILRAKPQILHRYLLNIYRGPSTMFSIARLRAKQMNGVPGARVGVTVKSWHEGPPSPGWNILYLDFVNSNILAGILCCGSAKT